MKKLTTRINILVCLIFFGIIILSIHGYIIIKNKEVLADPITLEVTKQADLQKEESDTRGEVEIPILMYHHIRDYNNENDPIGTNLSVAREEFENQLSAIIREGYTTILLKDIEKFPQEKLPDKPIVLTFDDGYDNNYYAYEILKKHQAKGVFFIIQNRINKTGHLTSQQIIEILKNNMEIGSHTLTHPDLTKISEKKLFSELSESKNELEKVTGSQIQSFCYPSGKYDEKVTKTVSDIGYKIAVTTKPGIAKTSDDKFTLKRIRVNRNERIESFLKKLM